MRVILTRQFNPIAFGKAMIIVALLITSTSTSSAATSPAATSPAANDDLPSAEAILDGHVAATGGKQAHRQHVTYKMTGALEVDVAGHVFEAKVVVHKKAPNYHHLTIEGTGFFMVRVTDGEEAWEWRGSGAHDDEDSSQLPGTTLLTDEAKAQALEQGRFYSGVNWRENFKNVETIGIADVKGKPAFEVRVTTPAGEQYTQFYDQESGRLVKFDRSVDSPNTGKIDMEVFVGGYREIDGVWLATEIEQVLDDGGAENGTQVWKYTDIRHNVEIPTKLFAMPEELKEQLEK